jgi:hypothetical protein
LLKGFFVMSWFRGLGIVAFAATAACVAAPAPEANGYDVQLYFEGAPIGAETLVGTPAVVTVRRLEQRTELCSGTSSCDPTSETPITLVSAACDAVCDVAPITGPDGAVTLQATADSAGSTTLRVRVRSQIDGAEWDDAYPLAFRDAPAQRAILPSTAVEIDKSHGEK